MQYRNLRFALAVSVFFSHQTVLSWFPSSPPNVRHKRHCDRSIREQATRSTEDTYQATSSVYKVPLDDNAVTFLQKQLLAETNEPAARSLVQVEGYLISKRGFGPSFCFMDISRRGVQVPVQAMLKRQSFGNAEQFDGFMKSLVPGIRITITGPVAPTRNPGEAVILVQEIEIQQLPHNPQHVRKLLRLCNEGLLEPRHFATAAKWNVEELLQEIHESKQRMDPAHPKIFNGLAKRILEDLREQHERDVEYPDFSSDHKYTNNLPVAPVQLQYAPSLVTEEVRKGVFRGADSQPLSVEATVKKFKHSESGSSRAVESVTLTGFVQNRRRFRGSISSLEIVDEMIPGGDLANQQAAPEQDRQSMWKQRIKCIVHPEVLQEPNMTHAEMLGQLLAPECQVRLKGYILPGTESNGSVPALWIRKSSLLRSSWRPNVVQLLIEQVVAKRFEVSDAARALQLSHRELERIVALEDLTKRQWESADIARRLQRETVDLSFHVDPHALSNLDDFEELRKSRPLKFVDVGENKIDRTAFVSTDGSRWKRKKEPQLEWMTQQVARVLQQSYPGKFDDGKETLRILDVGGGKGFLANHLSQALTTLGYKVKILVVDVAEGAIHNGRLRTERRELSHVVEYKVADASTVNISDHGGIDMVVALHACGALTDVALGHAVDQHAAFVICPCCFLSNPGLRISGADATQSLIPVEEWLGVDAKRYDRLKSLAEVQGDLNLANRAIHTICALRSSSVERHAKIPMHVSVQTFPVAFSTRNFCLVGGLQ